LKGVGGDALHVT